MFVHRTSGLRSCLRGDELGDWGCPRGGKGRLAMLNLHLEFVMGITQDKKKKKNTERKKVFPPWSLCKPPRQNGSSPPAVLKTTLLSALLLNWVPIS